MSIASLTQRVRNEVKCYGFWRQTSIAKKKTKVASYIESYLDETSKPDAARKKAGYETLQHGNMVPQVQGIDYLSKEPQGRLRAFGFLRDDVAQHGGKPPHLLPNDTLIMACKEAWDVRIEPHGDIKKFGYKFVLSLDPKYGQLMTAAGHDADALLVHGFRHVFRHLAQKYYPGDRLGYLIGIHHDRAHLHGHALLFPFTESGVPLRVSDNAKDHRFHELRHVADKFVRQYFLKNFDRPLRASERPVDTVMQTRILARIVVNSLPPDLAGKPEALPWLAEQKRQLQARPEHVLRDLLVESYDKFLDLNSHWVKEIRRDPHKLVDALRANSISQMELQDQLGNVAEAIKEAKARLQQTRDGLTSAQQAFSHCRFYFAHARGHGMVAYEAGTREQRKWLTDLFSNPALAATAREALGAPLGPVVAGMHERGILSGLLSSEQPAVGLARRNSRDVLRTLFIARVDELAAEREKIRADLTRAYEAREGLLIKLDSVKLGKALFEAAGQARLPLFLEQYAGLKRMGVEMPVLCHAPGPKDIVAPDFTEKPMHTFEELNKKIINTLRAFQGAHTQEDVFEVDRYFRAVTDATTTPAKKQVQAAAQAEVTQLLANPSVQDFLLAQNTARKDRPDEQKSETLQRVSRAVVEISL